MTLPRRDLLKILAGIPLALGLPALGAGRLFAGDGDGAACPPGGDPPRTGAADADAIRAAIDSARDAGRPALLVVTPTAAVRSAEGDGWARCQRIARRLAGVLESTDVETQIVVAQLVIVVATHDQLRAAHALPAEARDAAPGPVSPVWLVPEPTLADDSVVAARLRGALDGTDDDAKDLVAAIRHAVRGPELARLVERSRLEKGGLGAAFANVERSLAALGDPDHSVREKASAALRAERAHILATLAHAALTADDAEVRARCADLLRSERPAVPLGTEWAEFHRACGQNDPYDEHGSVERCGRGSISPVAQTYLRILTSDGR